MVRHNEGLTKTYNRFHDPYETSPDILQLRQLHAAMDRAVLDEVLARLLALNAERAEHERLMGVAAAEKSKGNAATRRKKGERNRDSAWAAII